MKFENEHFLFISVVIYVFSLIIPVHLSENFMDNLGFGYFHNFIYLFIIIKAKSPTYKLDFFIFMNMIIYSRLVLDDY